MEGNHTGAVGAAGGTVTGEPRSGICSGLIWTVEILVLIVLCCAFVLCCDFVLCMLWL